MVGCVFPQCNRYMCKIHQGIINSVDLNVIKSCMTLTVAWAGRGEEYIHVHMVKIGAFLHYTIKKF